MIRGIVLGVVIAVLIPSLAPAGEAARPNPALTPGARTSATADQLCDSSFHASSARHVTAAMKRKVCTEYGIKGPCPDHRYEVDHLIPLELGGSNDLSNLWPEPYEPRPGAHEKDKLETWLHRRVCSGVLKLTAAQHEIATDWFEAYQRMEGQ
jgi:hypothetical protein